MILMCLPISFHPVTESKKDPQVTDVLTELGYNPQLLHVVAVCIITCWDQQTFVANFKNCFSTNGFSASNYPGMVNALQAFYKDSHKQSITQRRGALFEDMCDIAFCHATDPEAHIHRRCQLKFLDTHICGRRCPALDFAIEYSNRKIQLFECKVSLDGYLCGKDPELKRRQKLTYMACVKWVAYQFGISMRSILVSLRSSASATQYIVEELPIGGLEVMEHRELYSLLEAGFRNLKANPGHHSRSQGLVQ